jgi:hypothetical protein
MSLNWGDESADVGEPTQTGVESPLREIVMEFEKTPWGIALRNERTIVGWVMTTLNDKYTVSVLDGLDLNSYSKVGNYDSEECAKDVLLEKAKGLL